MASLLTPKTRFLHMPKTGGQWVSAALEASGVPTEYLMKDLLGHEHAGLAETTAYGERFTFAFIRHPLDWWRSYWGFRKRIGLQPNNYIDSKVWSEDFTEYIEQVIVRLPGVLDEMAANFLGPREAPISFIGRMESLVDDTVHALNVAGETFDESALRAQAPQNANDYERTQALYPRTLAERLATVENQLISRFYADDPIPSRLLLAPAA